MVRVHRSLLAAAIATAFGVSALASVTPHRREMIVMDERPLPRGFAKAEGRKPENPPLSLKIALVPKDRDGLEKALYAVGTPGSASYGQHLGYQDVKAFMEPSPEAAAAVTKWLFENEITDVKPTGAFNDWLSFSVPVLKAGSLLNANYESFRHLATGQELVRTLQYSVPEELRSHIALVHPTTSFAIRPVPEPRLIANNVNFTARANPTPSSCNSVSNPACLQALYGIPTTPATQKSNRLGVTGFINQWAQDADLKTFLGLLRPDMSSDTSFEVQSVDGGVNPQGPGLAGVEANLDIQYTVGIATGVPVTFITVGEGNQDDVSGFLDVIDFLIAEEAPPAVLSTSYGFDEFDLGSQLATRLCDAYAALGARGVSNIFASGDGGVWGARDNQCEFFQPTFPAGCPFITSVGSTSPGSSSGQEIASDFSSGGFSDVFSRPSYQDSAVTSYLQTIGNANSGRFDTNGRAYPDLSARGIPIAIVNDGSRDLVQGTSASAPIFASVIALINDRLVAAGKPVLGFLNPFLYAHPEALFDTAAGENDGPNCQEAGFPSISGWDASTGLGTPNFPALLTAAGI
ncbi:hypothetical protein V5O48_008125 [Marasmius crinis-equi]|uniref:tripeptidyl-peptidase II n=1 Tax=Marasmius crinis-equi TaxID=585013 RepID=A0ABR3FER4_9AGAR